MRKLLITGALAVAACGSPSGIDDRWAVPEDIQYAPGLGIDLATMHRTDSGLYWADLEPGEGEAASVGDENVRVHYTLWLPDGSQVFAETIEVRVLGYGLMIRAFDEGIVGMSVGGVRQLVAPPALAFGRAGNPNYGVPPLSTVIFRVERLTTIAHTSPR